MATELESKNTNPLHKEFQSLLDEDFKDRKVKENEIIILLRYQKLLTNT